MEALNTGSAFRDPSRPIRKKAGGKKGKMTFVTQFCHACHDISFTQIVARVFTMTDSLSLFFSARPVDLRRSRTRTNIPVQKIMDAQNAIDQQNNAVDIQIDDGSQPVPPSRRKKDDRRGGEKTEEELEDEAQDILERLKKL